ncbi:MAG: 2-hydroxyacyl-CoA dehydratase family protein [Mesosutterella sp.]|nr:2-hydroxyacyl-CoA dehydratase family protein [Mesosutterella sp.]
MKRTKPTPVLDWFKRTAQMLENPETKAWKAAGGKVIGMFYPDTPAELLEAAGAMTFSLRGNTADGTELADAYYKPIACEFTRATFNEILDGKYSFLDGAVWFNNCDHMRRIWDNWKACRKDCPAYAFIYFPKKRDDNGYAFFKDQVRTMIAATEERFGVKITPEKVREAIRAANETRRLIRELYELKKGDEVYLDGTETASVLMTLTSVPRAVANEKLAALIKELKSGGETVRPACRFFYDGFHADRPEIIATLEQDGGVVVCDSLGNGLASAARDIPEEGDPIENVLHYYYWDKVPQPRVFGTQGQRLDRVEALCREFGCQGVIAMRIAFCDQQAFEQLMLLWRSKKNQIPFIQLETTYRPEGIGQIRTRIQAFQESIASRTAAA